jgi:hypothetical protein
MGGEPQHGLIEADEPGPAPPPVTDAPGRGTHGRHRRRRPPTGAFPPSHWVTVIAFAIVVAPFAVAVGRLLAAPGGHLYLPDDLALIDLHTRRALQWSQQLGVFDHNGWNHPGPTYFYLLSPAYRVLGSGARALFVGATLINALSAVACLAVVRRWTTPTRTLWAALWICLLAWLLAAAGPASTTYSEGALGGLVSPWNPMVIIFPLLLLVILCGAAMDRSALSLVGAVLVASFVIQTNISALPPVVALVAAAGGTWLVTAIADRRHRAGPPVVDAPGHPRSVTRWGRGGPIPWGRRQWAWAAAGAVAFVLMWVPPLVQQLTNHPGNLTLIVRFFRAPHPGHSAGAALWSVAAVYGVLVHGPAEVMRSYLGRTPHHVVSVVVVSVLVVLLASVVAVVGVRQRNRFAAGLGVLGLVGTVATAVAVTRVVGPVFGYLVVWAVALPFAVLVAVGVLDLPPAVGRAGTVGRVMRRAAGPSPLRLGLCALGLVAGVLAVVRVAAIPPLGTVSDPQVGRLYTLVTPRLDREGSVFVGDNGAGTGTGRLLDVERFVGLVNRLDQSGYRPTVNHFWKAQFGPGYLTTGSEDRSVELGTWHPSSPGGPGYVGRVGDMAVTVTDGSAGANGVTGASGANGVTVPPSAASTAPTASR